MRRRRANLSDDPRRKAATPLWLPAHAGKPLSVSAWTCGSTPFLTFGDVVVSYEAGWAGVDIDKKWIALATDVGGEVHTILGRPALIQPAVNATGYNQVLIVIGDVLIRVSSASTVSIARNVALAKTLNLNDPVRTIDDARQYLIGTP